MLEMEDWGSLERDERSFSAYREGYLACMAEALSAIEGAARAEDIEPSLLEALDMTFDWCEHLEGLTFEEGIAVFRAGRSLPSPWRKDVAGAVARLFGCRLVTRERLGGSPHSLQLWFLGYETLARSASATYLTLARACQRVGHRSRRRGESASAAVASTAARVMLALNWASREYGTWAPNEVEGMFRDVLGRLAAADSNGSDCKGEAR